jgi:hypothetical protein
MRQLKFIAKIGGELEGGWNKQRTDLIPDGSVHAQDFSNSVVTGELLTPKPLDNLEDCLTWLKDNYPTETTGRCGKHWHFSFNSINSYTQLMDMKFYDYFIDEMKKFGKLYPITNEQFWNRLDNKNQFCKKLFIPEKQIKITKKVNSDPNRYTHLNFAWGIHKTLECRLFPTFISYKTAQAALIALVDCIENYLEQAPAVKEVIEEELSFEDDGAKNSDESVEVKSGLFKLKPFNLYEKREVARPYRGEKKVISEKEMIMIKQKASASTLNRPVRNRSFDEIVGIAVSPTIYSDGYVSSSFESTLSTLDSDDN